jgi:periplasmic protein TonB
MFADSLLDSAWAHRSHRSWTTLISFSMQALLVGAVLTIPLLYPERLPSFHRMRPEMIGPPPWQDSAPKIEQPHGGSLVVKSASGLILMTPRRIPRGITPDTGAPVGPPPELLARNGPGDGPPGVPDGFVNSTGGGNALVIPPRPIIRRPPTSHVMEGNLVHRAEPTYPPLAIQTRTQGQVVLQAMIRREGKIENLQVISGHPFLVKAAIDAVRQWRYQPYVLNGEPVEVETRVTVNFVLSGG